MSVKTACVTGAAAAAMAAASAAHAGETVTYTYDALGRVAAGLTARSFSYDANGNRFGETRPGAAPTSCP
jgi:YD repeat-containing protein